LIFISCGLAICFHASLFNIGAEGQLNAGSFAMALTAIQLDGLPLILNLIVSALVGFTVAGVVGIVPAIIKVKKDVSEVITTIMMNFVILALINYLMVDHFAVKSTLRTVSIGDDDILMKASAMFPFFEGSSLNISFLFALLTAVAVYVLIYKTTFGYKLRAVGFNDIASKYIGVKVNRIILLSFFMGAGITAFTGINYIFGYKGYYELGFSNNIGFTAIAVALLAKNNPIGIIFSSILFAVLDYGGLAVNQIIPKEVMLVVQGLIILSILSSDSIVRRYYLKKGLL
jgi:simple sugar transport system permease protein